ncbi:MAG: hypothetical protein MJE77_30760 [Proteobacteria bacterium]|nr:hypothetical protein [Pseudomonadota bacterium]
MRTTTIFVAIALFAGSTACGYDYEPSEGNEGESTELSGLVIDFQGGSAITEKPNVSVMGLEPEPSVTVNEAEFEMRGVPPNSAFYLVAESSPTYRKTYSPLIQVGESTPQELEAFAIAENYLETLATAAGTTLTPEVAIVIAQVRNEAGQPAAGVSRDELIIAGQTAPTATILLDADKRPNAALTAISSSGYVAFYGVTPGQLSIAARQGSDYAVESALIPAEAGAVSVAEIELKEATDVDLPQNVSFAGAVVPAFAARFCTNCHGAAEPIDDDAPTPPLPAGGLPLAGDVELIYEAITTTVGTPRINRQVPEQSILLTLPLPDPPGMPDGHPVDVFSGPTDAAYLTILAWIREGARLN